MEENKPYFVKRGEFLANEEYKKWLGELKQRLRSSQVKAAVRVNTAVLEFYWNLGCDSLL